MTLERDGDPGVEPTPRRLQDARRAGDVPISPGLNAWAALAGASLALVATAGGALAALAVFSRDVWGRSVHEPVALLASATALLARITVPVLAAAFLAAVLMGVVQTRALFAWCLGSRGRARPSAWPPLRALLWAIAAGLVAVAALRPTVRPLLGLFGASPGRFAEGLAASALAWLGPLLFAAAGLAVVDLLVRRWLWRRRLRMTAREVRREQREEEGDPWIVQRRREAHRERVVVGDGES